MRGRLGSSAFRLIPIGTTPAHAGKTIDNRHRCRFGEDHPRACGEDTEGVTLGPRDEGPPPRMRGRQTLVFQAWNREGTTPAHAGKT